VGTSFYPHSQWPIVEPVHVELFVGAAASPPLAHGVLRSNPLLGITAQHLSSSISLFYLSCCLRPLRRSRKRLVALAGGPHSMQHDAELARDGDHGFPLAGLLHQGFAPPLQS